jgi:O-antigen ligase
VPRRGPAAGAEAAAVRTGADGTDADADAAAARPGGGLLRAPSFPVAVALAAAPLAAVLQSKAMAPLSLIALALAVLAYRLRYGVLPWPRGAALWVAVGIGAWGALGALWAIEPGRALSAGVGFAAMALLAGAAARAVAEDGAAAHRVLARCLVWGLALGLAAAAGDHLSGNALRTGVRGLEEWRPQIAFGLKPAASVMAMLLPLAMVAAPVSGWARGAVVACGVAVVLMLPGESAKIAALAGVAVAGAAWAAPRLVPRLLGAALAAALLAAPALLGLALQPGVRADALPPSAAHRLLIWDFALSRIEDRPVLGWGMEASRAIPGGTRGPTEETLGRFHLSAPPLRDFFLAYGVQLMPLHPHNGALQVRLELGLPGALLGAALLLLLGGAAARSGHPPAAAGALAAATVTGMLSFGTWQAWWIAAQLLVLVALAGLGPGRPR